MDKKSMVIKTEPKIEAGKKILILLDAKSMNPSAFLWFYLKESNSWRLVISSDAFNKKNIKEAYEKFIESFGKEEAVTQVGLSNITIIPENDALLNLLKMAIRTGKGDIGGIRFTSNIINGVLIEDAFIYRLF